MEKLPNIIIGRNNPDAISANLREMSADTVYIGWMEDENRKWIMFFRANGKIDFFPKRDESGAVLEEGACYNI